MRSNVLLLGFSVVLLGFSIRVTAQEKPTSIKLYLTDDVLRQEIFLKYDRREVHICNLQVGETYLFDISYANDCSVTLETQGQPAASSGRFKATSECQVFYLNKTLAAGCSNYASMLIQKTALDKSPAMLMPPNLTVTGGQSALSLIQDVFIGGGCFEISNVQAIGNGDGRGTFANGMSSIGIASGVILANGAIGNAPGPNNNNGAGSNLPGGGYDPDLDQLTTGQLFDVVGIEFDFVPTLATINFDYVFGSEEYCEWVGSGFNDVFGFFISGPGIFGPFSGGADNIAVLPGGGTAVAINNVNQNQNQAYFVPNQGNCGGTTNMTDIQYDGWTAVLTATANVIPCSTYHIKLVICDVGDSALDSGVFLKENSFSAGGTAAGEGEAASTGTNLVYESCNDLVVTFTRVSGDLSVPLVINYTVASNSTATPGVDYTPFPLSVTIPAGQTSVTLTIDVLNDLIVEGIETIFLELANPCACANKIIELQIDDPPTITTNLEDEEICGSGSVTLNPAATGGVAPLTYSWSNGSTSPTITVSPATTTTYIVTVTDDCGATQTDTATVSVEPVPTATLSGSGVICPGSNASVNLTVTFTGLPPWELGYAIGGVPQGPIVTSDNPYTLVVNSPGTVELTSLSTVPGMCVGLLSGTVTITESTIEPNAVAQAATCGQSNGSVDLSVSPAGTYTYLWSNGAATEDLADVPAGTYTVTVTGSDGCTATTSATVADEQLPINISGTAQPNTTCNGSNDGSISIAISPSGNYTVTWSNGASGTSQSNLPPGSYSVTVSIGGTCTQEASFTVDDQPDEPTASISPTQSTCGESNGETDLTVSGGVAPYTFLWSNGAATEDLSDVPAGSYTVTVTGANGCSTTASTSVTNNDPPINISGTTQPNTTCNGSSDGSVSISVSPSANYTITWSNGASGTSQSNLPPGSYSVTVSAGGTCSQVASFSVDDQPNEPTASISPIQSTCSEANGEADLSVSGGVAPYTFLWSNGSATEDLGDVPAGSYTVTVTGANGCSTTASTSVTNNDPPINISGTTQPNTSCPPAASNGSVSISISPSANYTITWSNGASGTSQPNLPPGSYSVTVSAGGTCTQTASFTVDDQPNLPEILPNVTPATCGLSNGSVSITVAGGVPPYTIVWSNGSIAQNPSGLAGGSYAVTVTGANGCSASASIAVPDDQIPFTVTPTVLPNTACNGGNGSISLSVTPTGTYTFTWGSGESSPNLTNLPQGSYSVTVSAGGTCTQSLNVNVPNQPDTPITAPTVTPSTCGQANGSAIVSASGSVPPYVFAWSNGTTGPNLANVPAGSYTVTVTGANGCSAVGSVSIPNDNPPINIITDPTPNTSCTAGNGAIDLTISPAGTYTFSWSNGATTEDLTNLPPGTYNVTVSAGGTCIESATVTVGDDSAFPFLIPNITPTVCSEANGSIDLEVLGGLQPYSFTWAGGQATEDLTNIPAGAYNVTVTAFGGCSATANLSVPNNDLTFNVSGFATGNSSCATPNGSVQVSVDPPGSYTYLWSNGATDPFLIDVGPGSYSVTVSAGGTCTQSASYEVFDFAVPPNLSSSTTAAVCGQSNGSINLTVSGNGAPYTYQWSNGAASEDLSNVQAGSYSVTVTDANGCQVTTSANVANATANISVNGTPTANTSCTTANGAVNITVSPTGTYTYSWSNAAASEDLTGLASGTYTVTVSGGANCSATSSFVVGQNANAPDLATSSTPASCGLANGAANLTATNGAAPYTFAWSNLAATEDLASVAEGTYMVTVTGANGCSATASVDVANNNPAINLTASPTANTSCTASNGALDLTVSPAGTYTFAWSNAAVTEDLTNLPEGSYSVTVSAGGECTASASFAVSSNTADPVVNEAVTGAICGASDGSIDLTVSGAAQPYSFNWSNMAASEDLTGIAAGSYAVTVTGTNGCSTTGSFNVPNNSSTFSLTGATTPISSCVFENGTVNLTITPAGSYGILWSNGQTSEDLDSLVAGTYTVTVTESGSCTASLSFEIADETELPVLSAVVAAENCGLTDGSVDLSVGSATAPFEYAWSGGGAAQDLNDVPAGVYQVTVTDVNGCFSVLSATVPSNSVSFSINGTTSSNTSCDVNNGGVNLSVSPAGTYDFSWSNGDTTEDLAGVTGGNFSVTVSAGGTCTNTASFTVGDQTLSPSIAEVVGPSLCGQPDGSIDLNLSGGVAPYTVTWSNGSVAEDQSGLLPGTYSVTVEGANGCASTDNFTIAENIVSPSVSGSASPNTSCDVNNGGVDLTVSPSGIYTFVWSNGELAEDLTGIPAGSYSVTVSGGGSCTSEASFTVQSTTADPVISQAVTPAICGENTGAINLSVSGAATPYQFAWSGGEVTEDLTGVAPGSYAVTVTGANGCNTVGNFTVPNNSVIFNVNATPTANTSCDVANGELDLTISPSGIYDIVWSTGTYTEDLSGLVPGNYSVTVTQGITCSAAANFNVPNDTNAPSFTGAVLPADCGSPSGSIDLSVTGGTTPYTFGWSGGQDSEDVDGLLPGSYTVTVTGADGCANSGSFTVQDQLLNLQLSGLTEPNTACTFANGAVNLTIQPAGAYTFEWSNGALTEDLTDLFSGTYNVTVSAGGTCTAAASFTVVNDGPSVTVSGQPVDVLCFGENTGEIDLNFTGGTGPYTVNWFPAVTGDTLHPTGLAAGSYAVTVVDAAGCAGQAAFQISQPANALQVSCTATNVSLPGLTDGYGLVDIVGGLPPYLVEWSPGGSQAGVLGGVFNIPNLPEGIFDVTVTDVNGCKTVCGFVISSVTCETALGSLTPGQPSLCGMGCLSANYDAAGQFLDADDVLQFILHEGTGNTVVNEIARNSQPDFCFDPATMAFGTTYYIVAVAGNDDGTGNVDLNDLCTVVSLGSPLVFYEQPVASANQPGPLTCLITQVPLNGSSTVAGSSFTWTTSGGQLVGNPNQPAVQASAGGTYTLVVASNGCADTVQVQVNDLATQVVAEIVSSPGEVLDCVISEIMLQAAGQATSNLSYAWWLNGLQISSNNSVTVGQGGTYTLVVFDAAAACADTASIAITDNTDFPPLFVDPAPMLNCLDTVGTLSGGSSVNGVDFVWATIAGSDTTVVGSGGSVVVNAPGTYFLIGTAPNGCENAISLTVGGDFTAPQANAGPDQSLDCYETPVNLTGSGTAGTSWVWSSSQADAITGDPTASSITVNTAGTYTLTVTNLGNFCSASDDVEVFSYENFPQAQFAVVPPDCFGDENGSITVLADPNNGPYAYELNGQGGTGTNIFAPLAPGSYEVAVTDGQGCVWTTVVYLPEPEPLVVELGANLIVELGEEVTLQALYSIPAAQLDTILWTPSDLLPCPEMPCDVQQIYPTNQMLVGATVVDTSGCSASDQVTLFVKKDREIYVPNVFSPNGDGINDVIMIFAGDEVVKVNKFLVFSRWGETVFQYYNFEPNNPAYGWDGKHRGDPMDPAVFAWFAEIEFVDGQVVLFEGDITLMR